MVSGGAAPGTIRAWFESGFATLGGDLREQVLDRPSQALCRTNREPHAVSASLILGAPGPGPSQFDVPYSARSWDRFLGELASAPSTAALEIHTNDARGRPSRPFMSISCRTVVGAPGWRILYLVCDDLRLIETADRQRGLLDFVRSVADDGNPSHGEISRAETLGRTALESAPLRAGGVWLRATPHWLDYRRPQASLVYQALAEVLGPRPSRVGETPDVIGYWE